MEVGIDEAGRLCVAPSSHSFPFIYREAVEVHWDAQGAFLYSPMPREWTYLDWFKQIVSAGELQGCALQLSGDTKWNNVPEELRGEIFEWMTQYRA